MAIRFGEQIELFGDGAHNMEKHKVVVLAYIVPAGAVDRFGDRVTDAVGCPNVHLQTVVGMSYGKATETIREVRGRLMDHTNLEGARTAPYGAELVISRPHS